MSLSSSIATTTGSGRLYLPWNVRDTVLLLFPRSSATEAIRPRCSDRILFRSPTRSLFSVDGCATRATFMEVTIIKHAAADVKRHVLRYRDSCSGGAASDPKCFAVVLVYVDCTRSRARSCSGVAGVQ